MPGLVSINRHRGKSRQQKGSENTGVKKAMVQNLVNQKASNLKSGEVLEKSLPEPITVDLYAERLMEDLFDEVDQILGENTSPSTPLGDEVVSLKPISVPKIVLPPNLLPPSQENAPSLSVKRKRESISQLVDRLLLGAAFTSLLLSLGLWWAHKNRLIRLPIPKTSLPTMVTPPTPIVDPKVEADGKFLDYIERSLNTIDQKKTTAISPQGGSQISANPSGNSPSGNLPTVLIPGGLLQTGGLAPAIDRLADALQKQESQGKTPTSPQVVVISPPENADQKTTDPGSKVGMIPAPSSFPKIGPVVTQPSNPKKTPTTENQSSGAKKTPTSQTSQSSPGTTPKKDSVVATTTPGSSPQPSPSMVPSSETQPTSPISPPPPVPSEPPMTPSGGSGNALVGILELGDNSAALFEIDGVARRFYVGESIGGSGWTLVEVKNQEARIRKGNETRSVFVGQKF